MNRIALTYGVLGEHKNIYAQNAPSHQKIIVIARVEGDVDSCWKKQLAEIILVSSLQVDYRRSCPLSPISQLKGLAPTTLVACLACRSPPNSNFKSGNRQPLLFLSTSPHILLCYHQPPFLPHRSFPSCCSSALTLLQKYTHFLLWHAVWFTVTLFSIHLPAVTTESDDIRT